MNEKVAKLLNEQVNKEFYSAYLYLDFANYYAEVGLDGFANWYRVQAQEERDHAMLFFQYLLNNEVKVTFDAIAKPEWERETIFIRRLMKRGTFAPCNCLIGL